VQRSSYLEIGLELRPAERSLLLLLDAAIDELHNGEQTMAPWLTAVAVVVALAALGFKIWLQVTGRGSGGYRPWGRISIPIRKRRQ
jgi:hypothetical protein